MSQNTCRWCGRTYGTPNLLGEPDTYHGYCCAKCEYAAKQAKKEEDAAQQREREARKQRLAEIEAEGGFQAKLLKIWRIIKWTFFIVVGLLFLIAIIKGN